MANPGRSEYLEGYADLSAYLAIDPDLEIFRRFTRLSARNLLYLQSEMASLEAWFDDFDQEDQKRLAHAPPDKKMDISLLSRNWESMIRMADTHDSPDPTEEQQRQEVKLKQIMKLRRVTEDALVRQNTSLSLQSPGKGPLKAFSEWFSRKSPLLGQDKHILDDPQDLVCLKKADDTDRLSRLLRENLGFLLGYFFEEAQGYPSSWGRVYRFREVQVERFISIFSILLSALLLVGSIVALYFETSPGIRLCLLGVFVLLFSISVGLLTNASRPELFVATAAYATVLVVFVSGNLSV